MRTLVLIEAFPIRNSPDVFSWVLNDFIKLIRSDLIGEKKLAKQGASLQIFVPQGLKRTLDDYPGLVKTGALVTNEKGDAFGRIFEKYKDCNWMETGIHFWVDLIKGIGEITQEYVNALFELHSRNPFDVILYWGNNGAIQSFSKIAGIPAISIELGCMRKPFLDTVTFDCNGSNGLSTPSLFSVPLSRDVPPIPPPEDDLGRGWDQLLWPTGVRMSKGVNLLIPLQLNDDSNIAAFSEFSSMRDFLDQVVTEFGGPDVSFLVKPHPGAKNYSWTTKDHLDCEKLAKSRSDCVWLSEFDNSQSYLSLLNKASGVITVNSATGFEATLLGKPVLTYGASCFHASTYHDASQFQEAVHTQSSIDSHRNGALVLVHHYLAHRRSLSDIDEFMWQVRRQLKIWAAGRESGSSVGLELIRQQSMRLKSPELDSDRSFLGSSGSKF